MRMRLASVVFLAITLAACGGDDKKLTNFRVPSEAMAPTFANRSVVKVDYAAYRDAAPAVGDVVILHPPLAAVIGSGGQGPSGICGVDYGSKQMCPKASSSQSEKGLYIKRVVAGPGDTVSLHAGHVVRNGDEAEQGFVKPCAPGHECDFPRPITVPAGQYFLLGDNRGESLDSRFFGPVPKTWILGKVQS